MGLTEAERRRWSPRMRGAVERSRIVVHTAEGDQRLVAKALSLAQDKAVNEAEAVKAWLSATKESAARRRELVTALDQIGDALRRSRPDRVRELAADPNSDLWAQLGPPPTSGVAWRPGVASPSESKPGGTMRPHRGCALGRSPTT